MLTVEVTEDDLLADLDPGSLRAWTESPSRGDR